MTVQKAGVYQFNFNLYLSLTNNDEGWFTASNYTIGMKVNSGATTAVTAVYAHDSGSYVLNYSTIQQLSANDQVQFYIKASDAESGMFANHVAAENGNAYLMQISD